MDGRRIRKMEESPGIWAKKKPLIKRSRAFLKLFGGDILSHLNGSTICADELNFSVRNGKR